jgi:hypothetical protein
MPRAPRSRPQERRLVRVSNPRSIRHCLNAGRHVPQPSRRLGCPSIFERGIIMRRGSWPGVATALEPAPLRPAVTRAAWIQPSQLYSWPASYARSRMQRQLLQRCGWPWSLQREHCRELARRSKQARPRLTKLPMPRSQLSTFARKHWPNRLGAVVAGDPRCWPAHLRLAWTLLR